MNIEFKLLLLFRRKDAHLIKFSPRECRHLGLELHLGSLDRLVLTSQVAQALVRVRQLLWTQDEPVA